MRGYLLDTHAMLWWLDNPSQLTREARNAVSDGLNNVWLSSAAVWEMSIEKALGRLHLPSNLTDVLKQDRIDILPIQLSHALAVADLPTHHHDPFDRMQIVQAQIEELVLITRDVQMQRYDVKVLEA